ncbi:MAG TPA: RDD family protein [Flavobacterium sp.]|nr:RDD family protein [Flavobacterium sp.]
MNELSINTSQNVNINFVVASLGERIIAFVIDSIIKYAYYLAISFFIALLGIRFSMFDSWESMTISFFIYSPAIFYTLVCESLMSGQTIGKRIMKIRVIKIDGYQASFGDYLVRWLFRVVEIVLFMGTIAVMSIIFNSKNQRLGDMLSGTAVVSLKNRFALNLNFLRNLQEYQPQFRQVLHFSDNDMRIITQSYHKALEDNNIQLEKKLVEKIEEVLQMKNPYENRQKFISTIINDYQFLTQQ